MGIKIPNDHLFCDWLVKEATTIRTYGVDMLVLEVFRRALLERVRAAKSITVTTEKGTSITLTPRDWLQTDKEIYTAPIEDKTNGTIIVDGCAYWGPPEKPFTLRVESGRVVALESLDRNNKEQNWVYRDLTRDANSKIVAELGIGINSNLRWDEDLMESEGVRGTCHFGFGMNVEYGGQNRSGYHFDLVIRNPTIEVDGQLISKQGQYAF